jgi:putative addiction module component (TIGR02574 family)
MTLKAIQSHVLKLSVSERAELAATLLSSLESAEPAELENAWIEEADRRFREYKRGRIRAIPAAQAMREARASLR